MLYPIVCSEEWSSLNKIDITSTQCLGCKKSFPIDVPVATKKYRGFKMKSHGCPEKYEQYVLAPIDLKEQLDLESSFA